MKKLTSGPAVLIILAILLVAGVILFFGLKNPSTLKFLNSSSQKESPEGKFCGGIAANLPENQCPAGYTCKLDGNYPDAAGVCVKN